VFKGRGRWGDGWDSNSWGVNIDVAAHVRDSDVA